MTHPASSSTAPAPLGPVVRGTAELCAVAEVGDDARALLAEGGESPPPPRAFLSMLIERELFADGVRFVAHALPHREAVWWAWVCARKAAGPDAPPPIKTALDAAERWIVQPTEAHRREALRAGEEADFGTAAGAAALAAFMTGGSLAPPDAPVVPPGEFMTAKAVAGSVTLAAVVTEPERANEKFQEFINLGVEVAERTKLWPR